jgi:hypothetical protein
MATLYCDMKTAWGKSCDLIHNWSECVHMEGRSWGRSCQSLGPSDRSGHPLFSFTLSKIPVLSDSVVLERGEQSSVMNTSLDG